MLWVALAAILSPTAAYTIGLLIYSHRQRRRHRTTRPTVADITARLQAEHREQNTPPTKPDTSAPPGYHWPTRDYDTTPELRPLRPRPYLIYSQRRR